MLFTQFEFPIFFFCVLIAAWLCRGRQARNAVLLIASYYFYAYWDYRFCSLLALSTVVDYCIGRSMVRVTGTTVRRALLTTSLVINLGVLGFFKYFNFFIDSASPALQAIGLSGETLDIILPVGVSFYTFQTLSYTIDVYRGVLKPVNRFVDFALYVAFFPQLVAGPIVRARELLPQLATVPRFSKRRFYAGSQQMLRGLVKKVLLADRLGEAVDVVFAGPDLYSGLTIWIAVLAYAGQIYYDFSGYSDIAIGGAKMLGYRFPVNFRHPYLSASMSEFWHRWHMTLSRWLRDYVYIALGGSRVSQWVTYRNLMVTMTLGGLWHGAAWTFVLWGVWHGFALSVERVFKNSIRYRFIRAVNWLLTISVILTGWVLFRSDSLVTATGVLQRMLSLADGVNWYPPLAIAAFVCCILEHVAWCTPLRRAMRLPVTAWYSPVLTTVMIWALVLYAPQDFRPFVYFQF